MQRIRKLGALTLVFCMIFSLFPAASAQEAAAKATYYGIVVGANNQPLSGVLVSDGKGTSVKTDGQGQWSVSLAAGQSHVFIFEKDGYIFNQPLSVGPTESARVDCGVVQGTPVTPPAPPPEPPAPREEPKAPVEPPKKESSDPKPQEKAPEKPAAQEPAPEKPAPQEKPAEKAPADEQPAPQAPPAQDPAPQTPAKDEPSKEEPSTEEPSKEEPSTDESAKEESGEPAKEDPAKEEDPAFQDPPAQGPAPEVSEPEKPASEEPTGGTQTEDPSAQPNEPSNPAPDVQAPPEEPKTLANPKWTDTPSQVADATQTFSWSAVEGAESYGVVLHDMTDAAELLSQEVKQGTSITVSQLKNGHRYRLSVQALAEKLAPSEASLFEFECVLPDADAAKDDSAQGASDQPEKTPEGEQGPPPAQESDNASGEAEDPPAGEEPSIPQGIAFSMSETAIQAGASVQFTVQSETASVTLLVDGTAAAQYPVEQGTASFSRAFEQAGEYRIAFTDGTSTSEAQSLTVRTAALQAPEIQDLGTPAILDELTVSWRGDAGAQQYALDLSLQGADGWQNVWSLTVASDVTQATLPANALAQAGDYRLRVTASAPGFQDASGERSFSIEEAKQTDPPMVMRAAVVMPFFAAPDAVVNSPTVTFNWHPVEGASVYRLSLRVKSTNQYLFRDVQVSGLTYAYNGASTLTDQTEYIATIYAVYANGRTSGSAQCEFVYRSSGGPSGRTPLQAPTISQPNGDITGLPFTITWTPVAEAASYQIALYDGNTQLNVINARTLSAGTTSFTVDPSLAPAFIPGHSYVAYVCAIPSDGNAQYLQSAWATKAFAYRPATRLETPVITYPTEGASIVPGIGNRVTFTWKAVPKAARYALDLNNVLISNNIRTNAYTINDLGPGTHTLKVQAHRLDGTTHVDDSDVAQRTFTLLSASSPAILSIYASPATVTLNQNFTLNFQVANPTGETVVGLSGTSLSATLKNLPFNGTYFSWTLPANALGVGTHALKLNLTQGTIVTPTSLSATLTVQPARLNDPVLDPIPDQLAGTPISVSWTAVEGAAQYDVTLRKDNQLYWRGITSSPMITIPATHTAATGTYGLTVLALPPTGAQTGQGIGTLFFNVVTSSIQPWTGWIQRQAATIYRSPSTLYPIGYVTWNQPVRVIAESGVFYQVVVDAQYGLTGYVLKQLVGTKPWSPCSDGNHIFVTKHESSHPHREYVECKVCGYWFYTGRVMSNAPSSQCCYCGNHLWGSVVPNKKHPHSTGTQTCARCGTQKTVSLSQYKLKGCSQCYPSTPGTAKPTARPTASPTPSVRYDASGNRLYDTAGFRGAFGTVADRNKSYGYLDALYETLRAKATQDAANNVAQTPLRVLLSAIFTPYETQWHAAQYDPTRAALREDDGIAYLTVLAAEACAKQDILSAPDGVQRAAAQIGQVLTELMSMEEVLDLEARTFLTVLQEQCTNLAASTPGIALTGTSEQNTKAVLEQLLRDIPYDIQLVEDTLSALALTLGEPDSVRALRVVYALTEVKHRSFTDTLSSLPGYATYEQMDETLVSYQEYLLSLAQLHAFAARLTDPESNAYASYLASDLRRESSVMAAYEATFVDD